MFVVNLAFSDFCMMVTKFPMFVHNICTMAVIAYDRYNVIVKGMSGTRMTSSMLILVIFLICL